MNEARTHQQDFQGQIMHHLSYKSSSNDCVFNYEISLPASNLLSMWHEKEVFCHLQNGKVNHPNFQSKQNRRDVCTLGGVKGTILDPSLFKIGLVLFVIWASNWLYMESVCTSNHGQSLLLKRSPFTSSKTNCQLLCQKFVKESQ